MATDEANRAARRVLVAVSRRSAHWSRAWDASEELILHALGLMKRAQLIPLDTRSDPSVVTFVAKERWDPRTYIVFDIFHDAYDPDGAHLPGRNDLPVVYVYLGKTETASVAGAPVRNRVNNAIQKIHDLTGLGSRPPFVVDHAEGRVPCYDAPRSLAGQTSGNAGESE